MSVWIVFVNYQSPFAPNAGETFYDSVWSTKTGAVARIQYLHEQNPYIPLPTYIRDELDIALLKTELTDASPETA